MPDLTRTLLLGLALTVALGLSVPATAQDILGHEYELEAAPIREGEQPVIPLDTSDPSYNIWRQLRDLSEDPAREPGIINIQKYNFGYSYNAMPTFFHLPVAMSPADLKASKVEVAIMGAVPDMGTGMRGAAHGPNAVRNSQVYGGYGARQPHMHTMVDPLEELVIADFGNAPIDIMSAERSVHAIRSFVRSGAEVGEISDDEYHQFSAVWLKAIVFADQGDQAALDTEIERILEIDPEVNTKEEADRWIKLLLSDLEELRKS